MVTEAGLKLKVLPAPTWTTDESMTEAGSTTTVPVIPRLACARQWEAHAPTSLKWSGSDTPVAGNVKLNVGPVTGGVGDEPLLPEQPAASVRAVRSARTGRILRGRCDMLPPVFPKPGGEGSRPDQSSTIPMRRVHSAFPHGA